MTTSTVPTATYRIQFNAAFTFDAAARIVDYLDALGISHVYASSYLKAVPGSLHGYDVADPLSLNPEIGHDDSFAHWIRTLRAHGMGHILDIVPNHMGIASSANAWWQDVLENGPSSRFAHVFDIDWAPLKPELRNKVLLPILGDLYGAVLERQEIQLRYDAGAFVLAYYDNWFPVAPRSYDRILEYDLDALLDALGPDSVDASEYLSILTSIRRLPPSDAEERALLVERAREKEVIKRRLAALTGSSPTIAGHIARAVTAFNGTAGDPQSFDRLDALLGVQHYRLAYWRVAAEEINYRRFFDINELAAIRMEDPAVFDRVHAFVFDLIGRGLLDGVRVDHVDGLYNPADYLERLQLRARGVIPDAATEAQPLFVVVEKILGMAEPLPSWPVAGTSGYDFLAMLNALFVDRRNEKPLNDIYERFTRRRAPFREIAYKGKQLVLRLSMASELNVLAHRLNLLSERNRHYRDFTLNSLVQAMREIIACFPIYRTYITDRDDPTDADRRYIDFAVAEAKRRNVGRPRAVFDFVRDLLLKKADYLSADQRDAHMGFVGKFQQVTSPVTAKGIEDTAMYNYNRLVSLNEVGSEPDRFGVTPERLHAWLSRRFDDWPRALSATSTHDTKRSEDVRARLNVLSELPGLWKQAASRWARLNRGARTLIDDLSFPTRNQEYLLYQTLLGSWPLDEMDEAGEQAYAERIVEYMRKALREEKAVTSWLNPSEPHEDAMTAFVRAILARDNAEFRQDFLTLHRRIAQYGLYTSLAQLAIKIGAPGIPDFYQGTELWDFSLVDPDNRRPVDYDRRATLLAELQAAAPDDGRRGELADRLMSAPADDRLKLYTTATLLACRKQHRELFERGRYKDMVAEGGRRDHVFAFARLLDERAIVVVAPRLVAGLQPDADVPPIGERVWGETDLALPEGAPCCFRHALTGERIISHRGRVRVADILARFPVAFLEGIRDDGSEKHEVSM